MNLNRQMGILLATPVRSRPWKAPTISENGFGIYTIWYVELIEVRLNEITSLDRKWDDGLRIRYLKSVTRGDILIMSSIHVRKVLYS